MTFDDVIKNLVSHRSIENAYGCEDEWIKERIRLHNEMTTPVEINNSSGRLRTPEQ